MSVKVSIIIIEDEENICSFIETVLAPQNYYMVCTYTGAGGLKQVNIHEPNVVLLDLGLSDMDGLEIIERVRTYSFVSIIVISTRTLECSKIAALDVGTDDYLIEPFGTTELLACTHITLRHSQKTANENTRHEVGDLTIDSKRRLVKVRDQGVYLTQIEHKLVSLPTQNTRRVLTYEAIISEVWGPYADSDNRILRVNMAYIRRKLEKNLAEPQYIFTETDVGYRMREEQRE